MKRNGQKLTKVVVWRETRQPEDRSQSCMMITQEMTVRLFQHFFFYKYTPLEFTEIKNKMADKFRICILYMLPAER